MRFISALLLAALVATSAPAFGQPNESAARVEYNKGATAYNQGHFDEAAFYFQAAYNLARDPNMLFNAAQSYSLAGKPEQALSFYLSYTQAAPADAPFRPQAERSIEELKRKLDENKAAAAPKAPPAAGWSAPASAWNPAPAAPAPAPVPVPAPTPQVQAQPAFAPAPAPQVQPAFVPAPTPQAQPSPVPAPTPQAQPAPVQQIWLAPQQSASTPAGLMVQANPPASGGTAEAQPFYKTWWFWTAVGAVVVAGTVTTILLAGRSPSNACGNAAGMDCVGVK